jgi:2-haloacid dehalogenase
VPAETDRPVSGPVPCRCRMRASLCGGADIDALTTADYRETMTARFAGVEALVFDMFGTVVDWRNSVAAEVAVHLRDHVPDLDAHEFADRWRAQYQPSMEQVRSGGREFVRLDVLHRENLETALAEVGVDPASVPTEVLDETNLAWHRLDPWPDAVPGLTRLKERFIIAPLSNANIRLALDVAKRAGLPWDAILGAEVAGAYKPEPAAYLRTAEILGLEPVQVMMVAAHNGDLAAAADLGLRTAFVRRPTEYGPTQTSDLEPTGDWDVVAEDFQGLADKIC